MRNATGAVSRSRQTERKVVSVEFLLRELVFPEKNTIRRCSAEDMRAAFVYTMEREEWESMPDDYKEKNEPPSPPPGTGMFFPLYVVSYLGSDFHNRIIDLRIYEDEESTREPSLFRVSGDVPWKDGLIARDAKLCIQSFVTQLNEYGVPCRQEYGQVILGLYDVVQEWKKDAENNGDVRTTFAEEMRINVLPEPQRLKFKIMLSDFDVKVGRRMADIAEVTEHVYDVRLSGSDHRSDWKESRSGRDIEFSRSTSEFDNLGANFTSVSEIMQRYNENTDLLEASFQRFVRGIFKVRCTTAPASVTLSNTSLEIPISTYVMGQELIVSTNYWVKAIVVFASRLFPPDPNYKGKDAALRAVIETRKAFFSGNSSRSDVETKASLAVNFICQFPQMIEYIQDISYSPYDGKQKPTEIFGCAFVNNSADCEDVTKAIYLFFRAFTSSGLDFDGALTTFFADDAEEGATPPSPISSPPESGSAPMAIARSALRDATKSILSEMQRILRAYVPFIVIEGVTAPNMEHADRNEDERSSKGKRRRSREENIPDTEENKGIVITAAHGALKLIPRDYFSSCLTRWNPGHRLTKYLVARVSEEAIRDPDLVGTLPILIGEGTGILEGGTRQDPSPKQRETVYSAPSTEKIKRPLMPKNRNKSPFYKALVFGFTDEFVRDFCIGKFHFCTALRNGKVGRGQLFEDFMTRRSNTVIIPNVLVANPSRGVDVPDDAVEFDPNMMRIIENVIRIKTPLPRITGPGYAMPGERLRGWKKLYDSLLGVVEDVETSDVRLFVAENERRKERNRNGGEGTRYNARLYYHHRDAIPAKLLAKMAHEFHESPSLQKARKGRVARIISTYANENHVDEQFVNETLAYFERKATEKIAVGDLRIYRENIDDGFYMYRLDFAVYGEF